MDDPIRKSMVSSDHMKEYTEVFGNRYGQPLPVSNELPETEHDTARMETGSPQSVIGVNDINLTSALGKRLMDDIGTGTQSKRHRATIRDRAKVNDTNTASREIAKKKMFDSGPTGGKMNLWNQFRLNHSCLESVEASAMRKNVTGLSTIIDKFDAY